MDRHRVEVFRERFFATSGHVKNTSQCTGGEMVAQGWCGSLFGPGVLPGLTHEEIVGKPQRADTAYREDFMIENSRRLGRKVLNDIASIVTPDTLMAWHRKLIAMKWDHSDKRGPGRPRIMSDIPALIVRMAGENSGWGYTRIQGALTNLGHQVARARD